MGGSYSKEPVEAEQVQEVPDTETDTEYLNESETLDAKFLYWSWFI